MDSWASERRETLPSGLMNRWMDEWRDRQVVRLPCPHLKPITNSFSSFSTCLAKRHLNDGQDGGNAYSKRYVYPNGVVFHATGSHNATSPTDVPSMHRQESRKSRQVVVPTSPMGNTSKTRVSGWLRLAPASFGMLEACE